jgi:hypothetical protein
MDWHEVIALLIASLFVGGVLLLGVGYRVRDTRRRLQALWVGRFFRAGAVLACPLFGGLVLVIDPSDLGAATLAVQVVGVVLVATAVVSGVVVGRAGASRMKDALRLAER